MSRNEMILMHNLTYFWFLSAVDKRDTCSSTHKDINAHVPNPKGPGSVKLLKTRGSSVTTPSLCAASQQHCFVYTEHFFDLCTCVCFQCGPWCVWPSQSLIALPLCLSLRLHPAEALAAVLVKRFVYPIRMMKRAFISTLPLARR